MVADGRIGIRLEPEIVEAQWNAAMTELAARINSQMAALHGAGSIAGGGAGSVGAFTAGSIVGGLAGRLGGGGGTGGATFVPPVPSSGPPSTPDNIAGGNVVPIRSSGQSSRSGVMGGVGRVAAGALGLAGLGFLGGPVAAAGLMGFGSTIFTDYNRNKSPRSAPIDYPRYLVRWRGNIGRGIERRDSYDNMVSSGFANHGYGTEFLGPSEAESPFLAGHTRLYRSGGVGEIEARMGEHRLFWTPSTAVARIYGTMSGNEFIDDKILRYTDVPNSAFDRTLITNFLAWNENFEYHPLSEQYRSWEHFVRDHIGGTPTAFLAEGEEIMPWDYDRRYGMMAGTEYDPLPMSVWLSGLPGGYGQERNIEGRRRYAKAILAARSRNRRIIDVTSDERGGWNPGAIAYGVRSAPGRAYNWLFGEEPASFTIDDAGRVRGPRGRFVSGARLEASGYERVGNEYRHPDRMGFFGATRFGRGLRAVDNAAFFGGFGKIAGSLHASREMRTSASHFLDWFEDDPFNRAQAFHRHHGTMSSSLTGRHRRRYNRRLRGILDGLDPLDRTFLGLDSGDLGLEDAEPARSWFDRQFGDDDDDLERKGSLYSAISMRSKMIGTSLLGTATFIPGGLRNVALGLGFSTLFGGGIGLMGVGAGLAIGGSALTFRRFARGRTTPEGAQIPGDIRGTEVLDDLVAQFHSLVDTIATAVGPGLMQLAEMISSAMSTIGGAIDWLQQYQGIGRDVVGDQAAGILQTAAPFVGAGVGALAGVKLGATLGGTIGAGAGPIGALIGLGAGGLAGLAGGAMAGGFLFGQDDEAPTGIGRFIQGYNPTIMENYLSDEFVSLLQAEPKLLEDLSLVPFGERRTSRSSGLPMRYGGTGDLVSRLVALNAGEPYSATEMSFLTNQAYMYKRSQELAGTPMGMARDVPTLPYESRSLSGMDRLLGQLRGEYPQYADRINVGLLQDRGIDIGRYGYNIPQSQQELMRSIGIWQAQDQSNERFAVQYQNMTARQALREDMASIETRRIQIGKELNQVMLEETQLRYSMIQHAAQEALDAPNELRSLNVAIARLKDYVGTAALPFGSPDNLAAHEQYMRVVEGFSSLEDQTLSGIRGAARRAGQSLQDYIESFISNTTGFQLPSDGLAAIMQQFGASEATEASEDLSLRMAANELQRRSNELTEENNRLLEQLRLVVYNLSQVSNRPLEGLSPPALEEALSFR